MDNKIEQLLELLCDIVDRPEPWREKLNQIRIQCDERQDRCLEEFLSWFDEGTE